MSVHVHDLWFSTHGSRQGYAFCFPKYPVALKELREAESAFKRAVPKKDRIWREKEKEWWIADGYDLSSIFANWQAEMDKVKRQLVLPGFEAV